MSKTVKNKCFSNVILPKNDSVKTEAVQTVIDRMGITKAAIFLRETMSQPTDYLALKQNMFGKTPASELYSAIKAK
jgi:hypothetical protein